MSLLYFEDEYGRPIVVVASKVNALKQNRTPTDTPVTVCMESGEQIRVRGDLDTAQIKLLSALG